MTSHDLLGGKSLADYFPFIRAGAKPATDIVVSGGASPVRTTPRRLTPERMRLAEILMEEDEVATLMVARKTILEWLDQNAGTRRPPERIETLKMLDHRLAELGHGPGTPGRQSGWLTSTPPSAVAPAGARTIQQALEAFAALIGTRTVTVMGK